MDSLPGLIESIKGDERNVILTLARMWLTVVTGEICPKGVAAEWVIQSIVFILSMAFSALAKDNVSYTLAENVKSKIRANLDELSVDKKTQDDLIQKLERGELWDSMNPDKVSLVPVKDLIPSINEPVKKVIFEDGSVIENKIDFTV